MAWHILRDLKKTLQEKRAEILKTCYFLVNPWGFLKEKQVLFLILYRGEYYACIKRLDKDTLDIRK